MNDAWAFLNSPTPFVDELYNLARLIEYRVTPNGLIRGNIPLELEKKIADFYDLDIGVGIYKTPPRWRYQFHCDNTRNCALNQLLCDPNPLYINQMVVNGNLENIPYTTSRLCLINTSKPHNIQNNTDNATRYLLNISVNNFVTYKIIESHLRDKGFID
jgi:hypothetical protein